MESDESAILVAHADNLEDALRRRSSPWRRVAQGVTLALVAALALTALIGQASNFGRPTKANTLPHGAADVRVVSTVHSGALTINGIAMPYSATRGYPLQRGANLLTLTAPGFLAPKTCVLQWPTLPAGNCQIIAASPDNLHITVALTFSLDDLPTGARDQLTGQISAALAQATADLHTIVPTGTLYATSGYTTATRRSRFMRATEPVAATLVVTTDAIAMQCDQTNCGYPADYGPLGIEVYLFVRWRFDLPHGKQVESPNYAETQAPIAIHYTPQGWQIAVPASANWTTSITNYLRATVLNDACMSPAQALVANLPQTYALIPAQEHLTGCQVAIEQIASNGSATGYGAYISRFGVLLAADSVAHARFPLLPIATPADFAAVAS